MFEGQKYTDNMCLVQVRNGRNDNTGRLCVRNMPFISVTGIIGDFSANGIFGLAPHMHERSFVNQLYMQGEIEDKVVGLNYEDAANKQQVSTVTFGYIDYNQIEGGQDGFNYYNNIGLNYWAVLMDDVTYIDQGLGTSGPMMAIIDSGNTTI